MLETGKTFGQSAPYKKMVGAMLSCKEEIFENIDKEDHKKREWIMEQTNVVEQLKHLLSYPYIQDWVKEEKLKIIGWHYIIERQEKY